jgi:hypothetical protein
MQDHCSKFVVVDRRTGAPKLRRAKNVIVLRSCMVKTDPNESTQEKLYPIEK